MTRWLLALALLLAAAPAAATLSQNQLDLAVARPPANAVLPANLAFTDQRGVRRTLGQIADGKPLVLLFVDYTCRHICGPGLTLAAKALQDSGLTPGVDYNVAIVGMDPRDGLDTARAMQAMRLAPLPRMRRTIEFLVGDAATVARATRALGYGYVYDPSTDQFAHDASLYVFAGDGHLASLLPELALSPYMARAAILNSGKAHPEPSVVVQVARLCYGFAAAHGLYGRPVVVGLQVMGVLLLGGFALFYWRVRRRRGLAA